MAQRYIVFMVMLKPGQLGYRSELITRRSTYQCRTLTKVSSRDSFHVIVAMPPPAAGRIAQERSQPKPHRTSKKEMQMGAVDEATALYQSGTWWRDNALIADVLSVGGLSSARFDQSRAGEHDEHGAITTVLGADQTLSFQQSHRGRHYRD
ncbi:hypothetical protein CC79DRAFT_184057 [Sarocladium strictum]